LSCRRPTTQRSISFDMLGWQQRSSGHRYNSPSGHALLVGGKTRKPVALCIKRKLCNFCCSWEKQSNPDELPIPDHMCMKNHDGSSSAMEPAACLEMVIDLYRQRNCIVNMICADDDASTRAIMRWSNADFMMNNNTTEPPKVAVTRGPNKGVSRCSFVRTKGSFLQMFQSQCLLPTSIIRERSSLVSCMLWLLPR
jgi:hypothetical protein